MEKWHNVYGNLITSLQNNNPKFKKITYAIYLARIAKIKQTNVQKEKGENKGLN